MKTVIYYFTGTGNSLAVAKKIAAALDDCELISIASLKNTTGIINPVGERVGIICPVYFSGIPLMVAKFASRLDCSNTKYTFVVVTFGGSGSTPALKQIEGLINKKHRLDAGFSVKMPGNYILMYSSPSGKKQEDLLSSADNQIAKIVPVIQSCEPRNVPGSFIGRLFHAVAYPWFTSHASTKDQKFTVSSDCTSCGTCAAVCPAGNIELVEKKPVWRHKCELCCGCIHLCPVQAIQAGRATRRRQRYHNPSVSLAELKGQSEKNP